MSAHYLVDAPAWKLAAHDAKNYVQAQLATRIKGLYCPSLFGHYGVNSACNLRCSYCYVSEPQTYPKGFSEAGLPLDKAMRVLEHLREEAFILRLQGGEPTLYPHILELARYAKERLKFRNISIITNGLDFVKRPERCAELLDYLDIVTLSIDGTRLREYPEEMASLIGFLPTLKSMCDAHKVGLTSNFTADWDELANPESIERTVAQYKQWIPYFYIMPVRKVGKTPLHLLKNSQQLMKKFSLGYYSGPEYPPVENVEWYKKHCNPKLKIKVMADGELLAPCENFSGTVGSLVTHRIRDVWKGELTEFPNQACLGCGKQRFRLEGFKRVDRQISFLWKRYRGTLDWHADESKASRVAAQPATSWRLPRF
ncbi:MAG TPA: radical SAM protein [Vicinamibacterales bacterium]|nr:radical SAM protein [Vicinamibacterales bacterium]